MGKRPTLTVKLDHYGRGKVLLDGRELPATNKLLIRAGVNRVTTALVGFIGVNIDVEAPVDIDIEEGEASRVADPDPDGRDSGPRRSNC